MNTVILDIFEFLELIDVQSYLYTQRDNDLERDYFYKKKLNWINEHICQLVQNIFPCSLINFPFIQFRKSYLDQINYIRNLYPHQFHSPIAMGQDIFKRPFIILKYHESISLPMYQLFNRQIKPLILFKHPHGCWSSCSPFDNSLFSHDLNREYLIFDQKKTSVTYRRLLQMYHQKIITIKKNNLDFTYSIDLKNMKHCLYS